MTKINCEPALMGAVVATPNLSKATYAVNYPIVHMNPAKKHHQKVLALIAGRVDQINDQADQ
ncbi:hypothetical protein ACYATP_08195 [Lactobacillaceae bacterium Melli_B4]